MNKWQKKYCDTYCNGKVPRSKRDNAIYELLGKISDNGSVTVHYPVFKNVKGEIIPAHTETFKVTDGDSNMPNGIISVGILASNLDLWVLYRDYEVEFS